MKRANQPIVLENERISLSFDDRGRITAFTNKSTGTQLLTYPGLEDNWRIMVLGEGYPVYYILGKEQTPTEVRQEESSVIYSYHGLQKDGVHYNIDLDFTASLADDEARFQVRIKNGHHKRIREVWYPILGGFQGFHLDGQSQIVHLARSDILAHDILHQGLPQSEYLFCVEDEMAHYIYPWGNRMQWMDLFCDREGLYVSSDDKSLMYTIFRLEKYPPETGQIGSPYSPDLHLFPKDTPRWMKISVGKLTSIDPGEEWTSAPSVFWPHSGDWHVAADHYRAWANTWMRWPERPSWLKNYVGWNHIVGKTYLNEVYHTFDQLIDIMKEIQRRCGVDVLMLYGHTEIGCEGANYDLTPGSNLGGKEGFRRLCDELHKSGMKVMVFTHRQSAIAMDRPEYKLFEKWVIKDRLGQPRREVWWKTTVESLMTAMLSHYEATGPIWARVCPYCDEWWEGCLEEFKKLMELGCDGVQLDTIGAEGALCYATDHGHKPGEGQMAKLAERLAWLRKELRAINPEFMLCGEGIDDWMFQYFDLPYSRYNNDQGYQVFHYTFPETKENVAVSTYSYDRVNKAFMLGMGMDIEVWGLKKSVLVCPELVDYINEIVKIKRAYPDYLMNGRYLDTLRAHVEGDIRYGVFEGPRGLAIVLWNKTEEPKVCTVQFAEQEKLSKGVLCQPYVAQQWISLPCTLTVKPHTAVAIIAER